MQDLDYLVAIAQEIHAGIEDQSYRNAQNESRHMMNTAYRLRRDVQTFERRWKEQRTANASPKAHKRAPEVKKKKKH